MTKPEKSVPLHADRDLRHPTGGRNVFHDDMMTWRHTATCARTIASPKL